MSNNPLFTTLHAIQLSSIETKELFLRINEPSNDISIDKGDVKIASGHTPFNREDKTINVGIRLSLGMTENDTEVPVSMRVEVMGTFTVDTDNFDEDKIEQWAGQNAPLILFPFIRENAVALTSRCGLPPLILPLLQLPTLK